MSMTLLCDYIVPCLLCEDPLEHVAIYRDPETGVENCVRDRLPHLCAPMREIAASKPKTFAERARYLRSL